MDPTCVRLPNKSTSILIVTLPHKERLHRLCCLWFNVYIGTAMHIKSKQKNKLPKAALMCAAIFILVGSYFAYAFITKALWPFQTTISHTSQDTINKQPSQGSPNNPSSPTMSTSEDDAAQKTPAQYEGDSPNTSQELEGTINYLGISGDSLRIRVTISQIVTSGSCTLTLTADSSKTTTKTAVIIQNPSSATCKGFDIPISELSKGEWNIQVTIQADGKSGVITGKTTI